MDNSTALAVIKEEMGALVIVDQPSLTHANDLLINIKALRRKFDDEFEPGIKEAFAHHRTLVAQKKKWTDPLDEAERAIKPKITAYLVEQDRIRLEAERAAERSRLQAQKEAEDASDIAAALIKDGKAVEAEQIVDLALEKVQEIEADTPFVPEKPVANGTMLRETWHFEVENEALVPREFMTPDTKKIQGYVTAMKRDGKIPGVRIFSQVSIASRIAR
jgi:hypothetical protein